MLYFLVTTSLYNDSPLRQQQYVLGILHLLATIQKLQIQNYKVILIENNGNRDIFLNKLGCEVFYTMNNRLPVENRGYKELKDIHDCIQYYQMKDSDFIVKMTGRYILQDECEFMKIIKNLDTTPYDCVIKYGSYEKPVLTKVEDCITGLIGMKALYMKQIQLPQGNDSVEWNWAKVTYLMDDAKICIVPTLGIYICPGSDQYFLM